MKQREPLTNNEGEVRELTAGDFALARPIAEVMPAEVVKMLFDHEAEMTAKRTRGKQKAPTKNAITLRLSPEIIEKFKATGKGWQSRINDVLLQYANNSL